MAKRKLIPTCDRLIVRRNDAEAVSKGGIHLPDQAKEKPRTGEVLAVGPGKPDAAWDSNQTPMLYKVGQEVVFGTYAGSEFELDGEKYLIIGQDEILAVIS